MDFCYYDTPPQHLNCEVTLNLKVNIPFQQKANIKNNKLFKELIFNK